MTFAKLIAEMLRDPEVRAALREAIAPVDDAMAHYTSAKVGPHPAGKSARWCRDHFRDIPGAKKHGRDWVVSVADFERWADAQTPKRRSNVVAFTKPQEWSPARALENAGLRGQRGQK